MKRTVISLAAAAAASAGLLTLSADGTPPHATGTIYVTGQDLYYSTFSPTDLNPNGRFQLLEMGPNGPQTQFGPGDPGYIGGRWMEDFDGDGEFRYFLCPLIGPGRPNP